MKKPLQSLVLILIVMSSYSLFPASVRAATYFKCPPGFNWQLNGNNSAVRCMRRSNAQVRNIRCPNVTFFNKRIGTVPSARSGRDKCVGSLTVLGVKQTTEHNPLRCPSEFQYRQNYSGQRDRCVKPGTTSVVAPTLRVNQ